MKLKRIFLALMSISLCLSLSHTNVVAKDTSFKRVINVVYDDSGSMISMGGKSYDTWCQAKYSMEVFASMLSSTDTMNVYYMSDYDSNTKAGPRLVLKGSDGIKTNVSKVHDTVTKSLNTPWRSVQKAYKDLTGIKADDKWLVILTDGEFEGVKSEEVNQFFDKKSEDIKVMLLAMGEKAPSIKSNETKNIFLEKAETSKDVLSKLTTISTRVFNRDRLKVVSNRVNFDVPMSQLIVFAQGKNVSINTIKNTNGAHINSSENVTVKYSTKAATNYSNVKVDENLVGQIAIFEGDFDAGQYNLDVTGAETIEVYYKPNVEIAAYLTNENGEEVTNFVNLEAGTYKISFGFVKKGTNIVVPESQLLGKIKYEAIVTNNDKVHQKKYTSNDEIYLDEGSLKIDAIARFLEYNTVSTTLEYKIFEDKNVQFEVIDNPNYIVVSNGVRTDTSSEVVNPIKLKVTLNGLNITENQWNAMDVPVITFDNNVNKGNIFNSIFKINATIDNFSVEKSNEIGIFYLYPNLSNIKSNKYIGVDYQVSLNQEVDEAIWTGSGTGNLNIQDERNIFEKYSSLIIKLAIVIFILFIIIGYIPGVKKYLPKGIKRRPIIECEPRVFGRGQAQTLHGVYTKDTMSSMIPYIPETGKIKYAPSGVPGALPLSIKALGKNRFVIVNTRSFVGKSHITFDGEEITENSKLLRKSPNVVITVVDTEYEYTCVPRN